MNHAAAVFRRIKLIFLSLSELDRRAHPKSDLSLEDKCQEWAFSSIHMQRALFCFNRAMCLLTLPGPKPPVSRLPPHLPFPGDRENELMLCLLLQLFPLLYKQVFIALEEEAIV